MPAPTSPANVENAVRDYVSGESCEVVAARHRISTGRLRSSLRERGLWRNAAARNALKSTHLRTTALAKNTLPSAEIVARYLAGESVNALANAYGVSRGSTGPIEVRLKAAGVTLRGPAAARQIMAAERTPEQNRANIQAAQAAIRGTHRSVETKSKAAATRELRQTHISDHERALAAELTSHGVIVTPQKAVGPYNVDLATGTVAVEVFGGGWHAYGLHRKRASERLRYILDQGWNLVIIWTSAERWQLTSAASEYIIAFSKLTSSDPAIQGQYRVIWGDGQEVRPADLKFDDLSVKPSRRRSKSLRTRDDRTG